MSTRLIRPRRSLRPDRPVSLTDHQLDLVSAAARTLDDPDKRSVFLERVAAQLRRGGRHTNADVEHAARNALQGLLQDHEPAA